MYKKILALGLSIVFVLFLILPTIVLIVQENTDIPIVFTTSSEEEKGNEKNLEFQMVVSKSITNPNNTSSLVLQKQVSYFQKKYTKPHLNIIFPPPETSII